MDLCHLKNSQLEPQYQKYKGWVVLRGDTVKDDSGSYAVFTEQASSASQMMAAKVMDIISSCQDAQDKQRTQYLLIPKSKWKMLTNYWKFPNRSVQIFGYVYRNTNGQNHGPARKTQSFLLSRICTVIPWQDYYRKSNLRKFYWSMAGRKFQIGNVSLYIVKNIILLSVCGRDQTGWEKRTLVRLGKFSWKTSTWENQHHSSTMWIWVALKENVKSARILWIITEVCSNREFPPGLQKNCQKQKPRTNLMPERYLHCPMTWKVMQSNAWKDIASWQTGRLNNSTSICSMHWLPSFQRRRIVCSQMVQKCLYLARIGRPDILWSVNNFVRSITKWTKACDNRLPRLIAYIDHTCEYRQCCYVGDTAQHCRLGLFQDSDFAGDLEDNIARLCQ